MKKIKDYFMGVLPQIKENHGTIGVIIVGLIALHVIFAYGIWAALKFIILSGLGLIGIHKAVYYYNNNSNQKGKVS